MAFSPPVSGDRFREESFIPKRPLSTYTAVVGDLVAIDTTEPNAVTGLLANGLPYGMVTDLNGGNGLLSVIEFSSGSYVELPYTGAMALGDSVVANAATRDTVLGRTIVKTVAQNGITVVVAKDADTRNGTGFVAVRYF